MDCHEPVDDYCNAWQADYLEIPKSIPSSNSDQFFIALEVEITCPYPEEDEDKDDDQEEEEENRFVYVEGTDYLTFWAPCPRIERENLPKERISSMLSRAGVPRHKQEFMVDRISSRADEIANAAHNKDMRVLPVMISISIVTCLCYGETVDDPERSMA